MEATVEFWNRGVMFLLDTGIKGLVLLALAGCVVLAMRKASAAARHLVWMTALNGLLLLPILALVMPQWQLPILPRAAGEASNENGELNERPPVGMAGEFGNESVELASLRSEQDVGPDAVGHSPNANAEPTAVEAETAFAPVSTREAHSLSWTFWLAGAWLTGVLILLAPLAAGLLTVFHMRRRARAIDDERLTELGQSLAAKLDVRRPVGLMGAESGTMPMTGGMLRPVIFLPSEATAWTDEKQRAVLLHELSHIKRHDCLTHALARLAVALHWYNPLAWLALRRLTIERERACDDLVLTAGQQPLVYADQLLDIARTTTIHHLATAAAITMARKSQLEGRLLAVLDGNRNRGSVPRPLKILTAGTALFMIGILSPLQLAHADSIKIPDYLIGDWQGEGKNVFYSDISLQDLKLELRFSSSGDIAGHLGANPLENLQLLKWSAVDSIRTNETFDHKLEARLDGMLNGTSYAGPILIGLINQDDHWLARPYLSAERLKAGREGLAPLAHYLMEPSRNDSDSNLNGELGESVRESTAVVVTDEPTTNMLRFSLVVPEGSTEGEPLSWHPETHLQAVPLYVESAAAFTESDLETISARPFVGPSADLQSERWQIHLKLMESAAQRFADFTRSHIGRRVAIVIDGMVLTAPQVNEPIPGGRVVIDGAFTEASARQLADQLRQAMMQRWLRGSVVEIHSDAIESRDDGSVVLEGNATVVIEANGQRARISGDRIELKRNADGEFVQRVFSNPRIEILNGNDRVSSANAMRSNANDRIRAREEAIPAIDIVAIGRPAKWPSRWWDVQGRSVSGSPSWMQGETGNADIAVVYRRTSPPGTIDINLTLPDALTGMSSSSTYGAHTEITWARMQQDDMEAFIANEGTVDLVVKAGAGPWTEVATIREGETIEADGGRFHLQRVAAQRDKNERWFGEDTPGLVLIEGRYDFDRDWEVAIVAEDQAGNRSEVESFTGSGMFSQHENRRWHQFVSMDKRDISRFIILKRPVQGYVMENLPLAPDVDRQMGAAVPAPGEIESVAAESAPAEDSPPASLAIHRVLSAPDVTRQESVRALNLDALEIDPEPLLNDEDIVEYDWETHLVRLKPGVRERIMPRDPELRGIPFMVVAHGERIYLGAFWTPASSFAHYVPVIYTHPFDLIQEDGSRIENAFIIHPSFGSTGQDPADAREDPRIHAALSAAGKLSATEQSVPAEAHSGDLLTAPIHSAGGEVILKSVRVEPMEAERWVVVAEAANRSDQAQHLGIEIDADLDRFLGGATHQAEIFTLEPGYDGHLRREFKLINRPFFTNDMNDVRLQIAKTASAEYYRERGIRFLPPDAEMILDTRLNLSVD